MHAMPRVHGCVAPPAKDTEREARPGADTTVGPGSRSRLLLEPLPCDSAPGPGNTRGRGHRQSKTDCTVSRTFGHGYIFTARRRWVGAQAAKTQTLRGSKKVVHTSAPTHTTSDSIHANLADVAPIIPVSWPSCCRVPPGMRSIHPHKCDIRVATKQQSPCGPPIP